MPPKSKLGIIAGGGDLPARLIAACQATGRPFFVVAIKDQADPAAVADVPHAWCRLGAAGHSLSVLREAGATELVMAGRVDRPSIFAMRPDRRAAAFLAKMGTRAFGDDALLSLLVQELEQEGYVVVGPDVVLSDLLAVAGPYGALQPDRQACSDIERGIQVARALGAVDVGQAVVVQQGLVLAVEAIEGTDAMLARAGTLNREGPGGVLVKIAKPGQERRADLPTIGPDTVRNAAAAGLRGIAIEAGATLILDRDAVAAAADEAGLFVTGMVVPA